MNILLVEYPSGILMPDVELIKISGRVRGMKKIRKKSDALKLARMMEADSSIELQITDTIHSAEAFRIEKNEDKLFRRTYVDIVWYDNVTGDCEECIFHILDVAEIIWKNRKYINQSGQLKKMEGLSHNVSKKKKRILADVGCS